MRINPALYWELMARAKDVELKRRTLADAQAALMESIRRRNDATGRLTKRYKKLDLKGKDYVWDDETTSLTESTAALR